MHRVPASPSPSPASEAHDLLERLGNLVRAHDRRVGARLGLQPVHLAILRYLLRCNRLSDTSAAVTGYLGATPGTVSQSISQLERRGLVSRTSDPTDRRLAHLHVEPAGREIAMAAVLPGLEGAVDVTPGLTELLERLQRAHGAKTFGVCHSCRFHERVGLDGARCALTGFDLEAGERVQICREHAARD